MYKYPLWWEYQKLNMSDITDQQLDAWRGEHARLNADNLQVRKEKLAVKAEMIKLARQLMTSDQVARLDRNIIVPDIPDVAHRWKLFMKRLEAVRDELMLKEKRRQQAQKAAETRAEKRRLAAEARADALYSDLTDQDKWFA